MTLHRPMLAALLATMLWPMRAVAQQAPAAPLAEDGGKELLAADRIAAVPVARRRLWSAYIAESRRLHASDTATMAAELKSVGRTEMVKAPYRAPDFQYFENGAEWFRSDSAQFIADAVLTFQTASGGWSKRTDMTRPRAPGMSYYSETSDWHYMPTFDNGATTGQLRFLARVFATHPDQRYARAYRRGLALLFAAQQPNGCWPQSYPLEGGYHDAITFNDDATALALTTLDEMSSGSVAFASPEDRRRATASARRGVACLVTAQVVVGGTRTVWGQQHDPLTLDVVPARTYEIVGLAGRESAAILTYLMRLPDPDRHVVQAVHAAAAWFRLHAILGYHYDGTSGLRADANGAPIWARLTEIGTGRPVFANRDGIRLYDWNQLTDRRTGYGWFGTEPAAALSTYDKWALVHPARSS